MNLTTFNHFGGAGQTLDALNTSFAVIEFTPEGQIITANPLFCKTVGYDLTEVQEKHHRIFVDPAEVSTPQYREFWRRLGEGRFETGELPAMATRSGSKPPIRPSSMLGGR